MKFRFGFVSNSSSTSFLIEDPLGNSHFTTATATVDLLNGLVLWAKYYRPAWTLEKVKEEILKYQDDWENNDCIQIDCCPYQQLEVYPDGEGLVKVTACNNIPWENWVAISFLD